MLHHIRQTSSPDAEPEFACAVRPDRDSAHVVVTGELDLASTPIVDQRLTELRGAGFRRLVLDLSRATFIDARAVHLILEWTAAARDDGLASFHVQPGPGPVQRVFDLTGTTTQIAFGSGSGSGRVLKLPFERARRSASR